MAFEAKPKQEKKKFSYDRFFGKTKIIESYLENKKEIKR